MSYNSKEVKTIFISETVNSSLNSEIPIETKKPKKELNLPLIRLIFILIQIKNDIK